MIIRMVLCIFLVILCIGSGHAQNLVDTSALHHTESFYVPAFQGTRLAVDVHFPQGYEHKRLPALLELTRYWRSAEDPETGEPRPSLRDRDQYLLAHDYILVKVDVRGTGASYGRRPGEYTPVEVEDARYILDWVVKQRWSDGAVGAYGTSYSGTTAELLCATGHPAVKAVVPGWSDFDIYESPGRPYGMLASGFISEWSKVVDWLDHNASEALGASIRRVHDSFPHEAIAEHEHNPNVLESARMARYKDSQFGDYTYEACSPFYWKGEISRSEVPMLVLTSWMDAGTAEGTLLRLRHYQNVQKVVLMPTSHGGQSHASPYRVTDEITDPVPTVAAQLKLQLDFFDHYLKGKENGVDEWPTVRYYNFGEEVFRSSASWPPANQTRRKYYLHPDLQLSPERPTATMGRDEYQVDFSVSTGGNNRWATQMGKPVLHLNDRGAADSLMLSYTSVPLSEDLQITGTPVISLELSSTHPQGAVLVYLEDVDPEGSSRYITEGGLLLEHRKVSPHPLGESVPYHSFKQADAAPMPTDQVETISFKLWPTSVLIRKGHSIRIALAGADAGTFDRVPEEGTPTYHIYRNRHQLSYLDLPVILH